MQYQEEQKYIQEHKEDLERLLKQEQDAMASETPGSLWEAFDHLKGAPKKKDAELDASKDPAAALSSPTAPKS